MKDIILLVSYLHCFQIPSWILYENSCFFAKYQAGSQVPTRGINLTEKTFFLTCYRSDFYSGFDVWSDKFCWQMFLEAGIKLFSPFLLSYIKNLVQSQGKNVIYVIQAIVFH